MDQDELNKIKLQAQLALELDPKSLGAVTILHLAKLVEELQKEKALHIAAQGSPRKSIT